MFDGTVLGATFIPFSVLAAKFLCIFEICDYSEICFKIKMRRGNLGEQSPTQITYLNRVMILNAEVTDSFIEETRN